jgi:hypothetical protein
MNHSASSCKMLESLLVAGIVAAISAVFKLAGICAV